jgi:hypothetical protein
MECCFWSRSALECAGVEGDTPVGVWRQDSAITKVTGLGSGQ